MSFCTATAGVIYENKGTHCPLTSLFTSANIHLYL